MLPQRGAYYLFLPQKTFQDKMKRKILELHYRLSMGCRCTGLVLNSGIFGVA